MTFRVVKFWRSFGEMYALNSVSWLLLACSALRPQKLKQYVPAALPPQMSLNIHRTTQRYNPRVPKHATLHSVTTQEYPNTLHYTALQPKSPQTHYTTQRYNPRVPKHTPHYTALQPKSPQTHYTTQRYNPRVPKLTPHYTALQPKSPQTHRTTKRYKSRVSKHTPHYTALQTKSPQTHHTTQRYNPGSPETTQRYIPDIRSLNVIVLHSVS
jgi:hypothetical protein